MTDNVTPLFGRTMSHQRMAEAAFDQVIIEGDERGDDPDRLPIRVTRLEMRRRPSRPVAAPANQRLGLLRLREVPVPFYRFLFFGVGEAHHWRLPSRQTDEMLHSELNGPGREVHVLYVGGAPAGFFELDVANAREAVAINCFGILPHARGRGLARWLLHEAVGAAWAHDPPRLRIQTNSLDSPIALRLYQAAGFAVTHQSDGWLVLRES